MDCNAILGHSASEPYESMEFDSHDAAYSFYRDYAKSVGFETAKLSSRRSRASGEFIDAKFSCTRYGKKQQSDDAINPRPSPKIGCKASMHVKRSQNEKWYVYCFVKDHNHELLPGLAHFFRSQWVNNDADVDSSHVRLGRRKLLSPQSKQFTVNPNLENLDGYLGIQHEKGTTLALEYGDAQILLELFMHVQEDNPKFFYAIDLNQDNCLRNVFWVDAKGMDDYANFGDVVSIDTTYFTSKYKLPLVLFIGVNHHFQPTILACALIADDTFHTFFWLMQTWHVLIGDHQAPRVILSDQNNALKIAIATVFPETRHCFCLWYVLEKIPGHLDFPCTLHSNFMVKFNKCIYSSWSGEQFEKRWWKLMNKFDLRKSEWFQLLYGDHRHWVPTFMKDLSLAGLSTSLRSDSPNSTFDNYIHKETSMRQFVEQFIPILENRYEEEAKADFDTWHETPELKSPSPFEKQMYLVYSHEIFKKFQVEVLGAAACHLRKKGDEMGSSVAYIVTDLESNQNLTVEWNEESSNINCSCRFFEYRGYLCRHAIVVLQMSGIFSIPIKYILQRWTNVATSRHPMGENLEEVQSKIRRYNDLCRRAIILGEEGSRSEESYNTATFSIEEAMKQCARRSICGVEEDVFGVENVVSKKKGKVSMESGVAELYPAQDSFYHTMDVSSLREAEINGVVQPQLHEMVPSVFQVVSTTQLQSVSEK